MASPAKFTPPTPAEIQKVLDTCHRLNSTPAKLTPKRFFEIFMTTGNSEVAYLRRYWRTARGLASNLRLLPHLRDDILQADGGQDAWASFIQQEASTFCTLALAVKILVSQEAPRGNYPLGSFHSSSSVGRTFFSHEEQRLQDTTMTTTHMPFLYGMINDVLNQRGPLNDQSEDDGVLKASNVPTTKHVEDPEPEEIGEVAYVQSLTGKDRTMARFDRIATTICSMVAFALNRRHNGLQLHNSVRFYACGVSERVQEYLNHLGLCSARRTALSALKTLSIEGQGSLKPVMSWQRGCPIAPTICIDNIDMEQHVHDISVGNRSNTFRGTWGYIHVPDPALLQTLNLEDLTLKAYLDSLERARDFTINPLHFMPTCEARESEVDVWKSQIAKVLMEHLAVPSDRSKAISTSPQALDQISHTKPTIHMLKLMDASDNSAEGIGQVFASLLQQSGLTSEHFYGRLQPMDGDLGTIQNFNSLKSQRAPSPYGCDSLSNVVFQLGASHTLWNIGLSIFSHHFGNSSDQSNVGAWQYLEALGFPSEKAIQKKDFTLMINQMEKTMEATLYYCLRVVMNNNNEILGDERVTLSTERWNAVVEDCYERFCSPHARREAAKAACPKLSNTLVQLHDFSSVVEAKRSMKSGDVGRLMNVWKKWCLMTQGLTGLTNYSSYLPRMVLQLTQILPPDLRKYLCHNLLISPSGRSNHFVAKDEWLKCQNYWIKFLFNQTGNGTSIDRLRDLFSINIGLGPLGSQYTAETGSAHQERQHIPLWFWQDEEDHPYHGPRA
ncbi:hypothetical protein PSTT_01799 [Puccinia striiformis]|uniref:DUF6589 domain-containing protein n=1 Tax=Puccinia striiformis TaxID=27350 RepID=A0A2S4W2D4_9BASI|nr:hypothetical protein PSTT_01799 [Puccinia striiformis]